MPVTLAGAFLVQAMIHGSLRVYGAENKLNSQMPEENRGRASRRGFGGTSLDHTDMVPTSIAAVNPSSQTHVVDCRNGACSSSVSPQSSLHEGEVKIAGVPGEKP
ncbi:uncharacterized protein LOC141863593 [Acropora palmata]|uniref:uncharacterized protein LOC141863593 n=1 Tax=Acropora palmata TaxID=6131 RepID=UPI003D9FB81A